MLTTKTGLQTIQLHAVSGGTPGYIATVALPAFAPEHMPDVILWGARHFQRYDQPGPYQGMWVEVFAYAVPPGYDNTSEYGAQIIDNIDKQNKE